jgi:glycosyltransferase involved in cell wall biosynthesis
VTEPLVSVIMAARNHEQWVAEALDSALAQTHRNLEVVVADDASTDATPQILADYARRHPERIRLHLGDASIGPCRRRADALRRSRGELIAWLDSDDIWLPTKTEEEVAVLQARPEVGAVYSSFEAFDSDTGEALAWEDGRRGDEGDMLEPLFVDGCFIGALTTMFRREAMTKHDLHLRTKDFAYGDDLHLWLQLALYSEFARIPKVLARYRRHSSNVSESHGNPELQRARLMLEFLQEFPDAKPRLGPSARMRGLAGAYRGAALMASNQGKSLDAARYRLAAATYRLRAALTRGRGQPLGRPG